MIIQQLDQKRLLINLSKNDLAAFNLSTNKFSFNDEATKLIIREILSLAVIKTGLIIKDRSLSVEALPHKEGCYILATLRTKSGRKKYHIKRNNDNILIRFDHAQDMLNAIDIIFCSNAKLIRSDLYSKDRYYYLSLQTYSLPKKTKALLSEYGKIFRCNALTLSVLNESSNIIRQKDAVYYIGKIIHINTI